MAFKKQTDPDVRADTPEKLFPLLPRTGNNSTSLWSQQTDLLREYAVKRSTARDLAIELPTGTGKTLAGLLIADWRRRERKGRAVFACPTIQLVRQVVAAAQKEGIRVVDLSGSAIYWDASAKADYERGRATAVVTYSSIFNSSPKLIAADVIVFDDAHAAEQYVSKAYTVEVRRAAHSDIFSHVLEAVKPMLSGERYSQLISNDPGAGTRELVDGLFLAQRDDLLAPLAQALGRFGDLPDDKLAKSQRFVFGAIKEHLSACTLYLSWSRIELRPATPPTFENTLFTLAHQRVYLSATLGVAGELERAFGRPSIKRLALPLEAPTPKSGRKFLVFPHLVSGIDPVELTRELIQTTGKSIVIAPSEAVARKAEIDLVPSGWQVMRKDDVEESMDDFADADRAVAVLANRYDGIDLPGEACRCVTLAGYPGITNLQEQFYSARARSSSVSDERVRSRVVQGLGRCTRHPRDWALVVVADAETTTYLSRAEVRRTLSAHLQSEVLFGLDQSETSVSNVRENVRAFLKQGREWRESAEPELTKISQQVEYESAPAARGLANAAKYEVEALERMWHADWRGASTLTHQAASELSSYPEARGYRATLLFRAAVLMDRASRAEQDPALGKTADSLAEQAVKASAPATWMNSFLPFEGHARPSASGPLRSAARRLSKRIANVGNASRLELLFSNMFAGLAAVDHKAYEPALKALGEFVGADAFKPSGDARTDSAWCWDNELWITLEAKSEHKAEGLIGADDVRQINGHLKLVAEDRKVDVPALSAAVMVSPRTVVRREGIVLAEGYVWRVPPVDIINLAIDVQRLWVTLHTLKNLPDAKVRVDAVIEALRYAHLEPEDILDRLTVTPIGSKSG
ncbi:DEAD/DEAH box helicase [Curtobacterium flaccumfaciens]|uniref:DEAD/DEAH box helicase n=1 Tax=Curtobacterium flaccumfaciens TaxID=2035 RepID=UPI002208F6FA|nr:DEAD/DEAH box helicase [Curtobacterium flaccumfaciens]UWD79347.1 DEAD/DEAH box helicase family protein [Curtobacterium flaccumfaciens]